MPVSVREEFDRLLLFRLRPPYLWWRLHELHGVATGHRARKLHVLNPTIKNEHAPLAYENAVGALMGDVLMANHQNFQAIMASLATFAERVGIGGLEIPLLTGLLNLNERGPTSVFSRIESVLKKATWPTPAAGGCQRFLCWTVRQRRLGSSPLPE